MVMSKVGVAFETIVTAATSVVLAAAGGVSEWA